MLWLLLACVEPAPPVDSDTAMEQDSFCTDAPVVRWANFGQGFIKGSCQGCHSSTSGDRHNAPEGVTFDTLEQVWAQKDMILLTSTQEPPSMPPNGGVHEDDRMRLAWWLRCAPNGT